MQAGFEFQILLPQLPEFQDYRCVQPHPNPSLFKTLEMTLFIMALKHQLCTDCTTIGCFCFIICFVLSVCLAVYAHGCQLLSRADHTFLHMGIAPCDC